jgi:hypothetical protein
MPVATDLAGEYWIVICCAAHLTSLHLGVNMMLKPGMPSITLISMLLINLYRKVLFGWLILLASAGLTTHSIYITK